MSSSDPTTATDSPSSLPTPEPAPSPVTTAPLRVKAGSSNLPPIPSTPANPGPDSAIDSDPVDTATGSTPSPSQPAAAVKVDGKSLVEVARAAVLTASRYVHAALANPQDDAEADLWIARDRDQAQIGDPLATVLGRRGLQGQVNPDVANLIEAGIGLLAYVAYHAGEAWRIRRARKNAARQAGELLRTDTGQPA